MDVDVLTRAQCEQTLQNFVTNKNAFLKYLLVRPLIGCSGYIGTQYSIKFYYQDGEDEKIVRLFLKKMEKSNPFIYKMSSEIRGCEKENFYYGTLLPLLKAHAINCEFAPTGYFCDKDLVVLEDLSLESFEEFPKKPLDVDQCKLCLETLAEFHVATILYELKKSKELKRPYTLMEDFGDVLQEEFCSGEDSGTSKYFRCSAIGLGDIVDLIQLEGINKNDFKEKLKELVEQIFAKKTNYKQFKSTVVHGDVWSSNFLCQNNPKQTKRCKLIDFQTISYGPVASDVILFIFNNTRKKFRDLHYEKFIEHYYNFFCSLLEKQDVQASDVLPEEDFKEACEVFRPVAKIFATIERAVTSTSEELYEEATQNEEMTERFWYQDRGKYCVRSFKEVEEYRDLMIEEITELAAMLYEVQ